MENPWFSDIKKAKKSAIIDGTAKKVHYAFEDGREMVEEYNTETNVLTRRAWRVKTELAAADGEWDIEIGDPEPEGLRGKSEHIRVNPNQPFMSKRITKTAIEWRIRNLPYKQDLYSVTVDADAKCIVVRTSNKKYFKRIQIPELERVYLLPVQENVSFTHKFNTLIISYKKPSEYIELEKAVWKEVNNVTPQQQLNPNNCRQT